MNRSTQSKTTQVRAPAVAGRFYPGQPQELRRMVENLLAEVPPATGPAPKALIAPHAGYIYSGPIAASAYAQFLPARDLIKRVVLLGPSHFASFAGIAVSSATAFATPLGVVPVDAEAVSKLLSLPQVSVLENAHAWEHALEVQLPFLQTVLKEFTLVPLLAGEASVEQVREVLESLWGGPETRLVISSDLSHYLDWKTARQLDRETAMAIETLALEQVGEDQACGRIPIRGLLAAARRHHLHVHTLDLRNSGDTAGTRERVVGYGAFGFSEK